MIVIRDFPFKEDLEIVLVIEFYVSVLDVYVVLRSLLKEVVRRI